VHYLLYEDIPVSVYLKQLANTQYL